MITKKELKEIFCYSNNWPSFYKKACELNLLKEESEYLSWHEFVDAIKNKKEIEMKYKIAEGEILVCSNFHKYYYEDVSEAIDLIYKFYCNNVFRIKDKNLNQQIKDKIKKIFIYSNTEDCCLCGADLNGHHSAYCIDNKAKFISELKQLIEKLED